MGSIWSDEGSSGSPGPTSQSPWCSRRKGGFHRRKLCPNQKEGPKESAPHDVAIYFPSGYPDPKFHNIGRQVFCAVWQALNVPDPEFTHDLAPLLPNATPHRALRITDCGQLGIQTAECSWGSVSGARMHHFSRRQYSPSFTSLSDVVADSA